MPADVVAPTFESAPPSVESDGERATRLAEAAGLVLDPWQRYALDRILAVDERGLPAAFEAAVIVPRQNGKGSLLEALSLWWLLAEQAPLVLHSAHEFKTASEAFRRIRALLAGSEEFSAEVDRTLTGAGSEAVEFVSGPRLRFVARSKGSGRGFTAAKVILDEAYAIEAEEMAALLPTLATQPAAQIVYTSSAGMASSDHLRAVRDRGRRGGDPSLCWLEWGGRATCPAKCGHDLDDPDCALNDEALWRAANPGAGIRVSLEFIAKERRALDPASFARERLGVWDEPDGAAETIPLSRWKARADASSRPAASSPRVLAFDVTPDRSAASIAGAGYREDGAADLALIENRPGTSWLVPRLVELREQHKPACIVVDGAGPAATEIAALRDARITVRTEANPRGLLVVTGVQDMSRACGQLYDAIAGDSPSAWHRGDPIVQQALVGAARRDIGDGGWGFGRKKSDANIAPIVALALAAWGLSSVPRRRKASSVY